MKLVNSLADPLVAACLRGGGVVVARTDTLYGVLARAGDEQAVARVYALKDRSEHKSPIVLIAHQSQLFDTPDTQTMRLCDESWPGPISIIIPATNAPKWLARDNASVAYRMPDHDDLRALIATTGALIAPSANPEGCSPARSIEEAVGYFGDAVDVYVDGGYVQGDNPSQLLRIDTDGTVERLR